MQVECRDEADAKALAVRLHRKCHCFCARTKLQCNAGPICRQRSPHVHGFSCGHTRALNLGTGKSDQVELTLTKSSNGQIRYFVHCPTHVVHRTLSGRGLSLCLRSEMRSELPTRARRHCSAAESGPAEACVFLFGRECARAAPVDDLIEITRTLPASATASGRTWSVGDQFEFCPSRIQGVCQRACASEAFALEESEDHLPLGA